MSNLNAVEKWYQTDLGQAIVKSEINGLKNIIPEIFGYFFLQLGGTASLNYLAETLVHNLIHLGPEEMTTPLNNFIQGNYHELPFANSSIDASLMAHILEFSKNPRAILEEIHDALVPEGKLIIICFNPHSLWGIYKWLLGKSHIFPWQGNYLSPRQLQKLLINTGFAVGDYKSVGFRPPLQNKKLFQRLAFFETLGAIFWPYLGASYIYVAKKTAITLTPVRFKNNEKRKLVATASWVKPTPSQTTNFIATKFPNPSTIPLYFYDQKTNNDLQPYT